MKFSSLENLDFKKLDGDFIVLADDDIDDQELLTEAIKDINPYIELITITNGNKAISFLNDLPEGTVPSLIVLDYNLPEVNGAEILQSIQPLKRFEEVTKVVWSTSNSPVFKKACLDYGAHAYLVKPSDLAVIQRLAQQILDMALPK